MCLALIICLLINGCILKGGILYVVFVFIIKWFKKVYEVYNLLSDVFKGSGL